MIIIDDYKEKRLIIARYFILKKNTGESFTEKDVFCIWKNYFPKDYSISKHRTFKFVDGKLILNHKGHVSAKCIYSRMVKSFKE